MDEIQFSRHYEIFVVWKLQNGKYDFRNDTHFVILIVDSLYYFKSDMIKKKKKGMYGFLPKIKMY